MVTIAPITKLAPNFEAWEFFQTSHDNTHGHYEFSQKLWDEFMALPEATRLLYFERLKMLAQRLQVLRDFYGKPVKIVSGWRSTRLNKRIGGATFSKHLLGAAADIRIIDVPLTRIYTDFKNWYGGMAPAFQMNFIHLDIRDVRARWTY